MKFTKATITYEWKDDLRPYANHTSSVVLEAELTEVDTADVPALQRKILKAQRLVETAVIEQIQRTRPREPDPTDDREPGDRGFQPPVMAPHQPPPAIAQRMQAPPPAPAGSNGNGDSKPPTNARSFSGWIYKQSKPMQERAIEIMVSQGYGRRFNQLGDDQAMWVYQCLSIPQPQPAWGGGQNGNGYHQNGGY